MLAPVGMMGFALLLLTGTLFAGMYALGKAGAAAGLAPAAILLWQMAGGAAGLACAAAWSREARPPLSRAHLRYYLFSGVLGVSAPNLLLFYAVRTLEVGVVTLLLALSPLFTYLGALGLRMERYSALCLAGCILGLAGVALLSAPQGGGVIGGAGLAAALGAPMFLASGNVYRSRAWPPGTPPMALAAGMLWLQLPLAALVFALSPGQEALLPSAALPVILAVVVLSPLSYTAGFALQKVGGLVLYGQIGYVITVAGAALGYLFFGERLGPRVWLAAALVLGGVLLVTRGRRPVTPPAPVRPR